MINKSVFEQDLIAGMQQELRKQAATSDPPNLVEAGECLHAALEILEEAGMQRQADQILNIMQKIAVEHRPSHEMVSLQKLMEHGVTYDDLQDLRRGDHAAKVKVNLALRKMGLDTEQIAKTIGQHNVLSEHDLGSYTKLMSWMKDPTQVDEGPVQPGQTVTMESMPEKEEPEVISFESIATRKPSRPGKVSDIHTKKLTPAKMVENLKHHGTEFNMPDLSWADFDPELAEALDLQNADQTQEIDTSLDWDLDLSDDMLEVDIPQPLEDFEDEVSK